MSLSKCTTQYTISAAVQQSTRYKLVQITASKTLHHPIRKQQYNPQCISLTEQAPDTKATLVKCIFTKGCIFVTPPNSQRQLVQQNPPKDLRKAHLRLRNFVLQKKTHPKILPSTPAICLYSVHIVNLYNDVFQSKPNPKHFVHCANNKPKTTDQLGKASNSFQVPYLLWAS